MKLQSGIWLPMLVPSLKPMEDGSGILCACVESFDAYILIRYILIRYIEKIHLKISILTPQIWSNDKSE